MFNPAQGLTAGQDMLSAQPGIDVVVGSDQAITGVAAGRRGRGAGPPGADDRLRRRRRPRSQDVASGRALRDRHADAGDRGHARGRAPHLGDPHRRARARASTRCPSCPNEGIVTQETAARVHARSGPADPWRIEPEGSGAIHLAGPRDRQVLRQHESPGRGHARHPSGLRPRARGRERSRQVHARQDRRGHDRARRGELLLRASGSRSRRRGRRSIAASRSWRRSSRSSRD